MDEELISKKELLERYTISYGALYRWKRMGLIPESWFLRRATPTGQETFFRRALICPRVELILNNKEHSSLEALAASLKEKQQAAVPTRKLIIQTAHGKKEYAVAEIQALYLEEGGRQENILTYLKETTI